MTLTTITMMYITLVAMVANCSHSGSKYIVFNVENNVNLKFKGQYHLLGMLPTACKHIWGLSIS